MAITHDYVNTAGYKPTAVEADVGELIPNLADGTLWSKDPGGTVVQVGSTAVAIADANGKIGYELSTRGASASDAEWSPIRTNPNILSTDYTFSDGVSGTVASGFEVADGVTITIPDGSTLSIV